jgi:hypothetical protein
VPVERKGLRKIEETHILTCRWAMWGHRWAMWGRPLSEAAESLKFLILQSGSGKISKKLGEVVFTNSSYFSFIPRSTLLLLLLLYSSQYIS